MTRVRIATIATALITATATVVAVAGIAAARQPPDTGRAHSTAHGTGFQIKSAFDNNFCAAVDNGTAPARSVTLSLCSAVSTQKWAFTWNSDQSNLLVETQGMCLDGRHPQPGVAAKVRYCHFTGPWTYVFTPQGLIKNLGTGQCLGVAGLGAGAAVFFDACDASSKFQLWKLSQ